MYPPIASESNEIDAIFI